MPLDPAVRESLSRRPHRPFELTLESVRRYHAELVGARPAGRLAETVEDAVVAVSSGKTRVRIYSPGGGAATGLPALLWFHGGGWVVGSPEEEDGVCAEVSDAAGCMVVSVDYRLAPEHKFPDALEDCYDVARWAADPRRKARPCIDPERMAVGGNSAGGNLAAALALMVRDRGGMELACQVLVCPVTKYGSDTASYRENATGFGLEAEMMSWYWRQYLRREEDGLNPYASPLLAGDLRGLPPALVITAEYDVLRDEGEAYAARLERAGVETTSTRYGGMIHGLVNLGPAAAQMADFLRARFRSRDARQG